MHIRTASGDEVPLHVVADIEHGRTLSSITRVNQKRALRVSGDRLLWARFGEAAVRALRDHLSAQPPGAPLGSSCLARPKSERRTWPSASSRMFSGLRSLYAMSLEPR